MQIIFGVHSIAALLNQYPEMMIELNILAKNDHPPRIEKIITTCNDYQIPIKTISPKTLAKLSKNGRHQNIIAQIKPPHIGSEQSLKLTIKTQDHPLLILAFDGMEDPRNFGASLRSAAAAKVDAVLFTQRRHAPLSAVAHHISAGASFYLNLFQVNNLSRAIELLKRHNIWCYGLAAAAAQNIYQTNLTTSSAIIVGSEAKGLSTQIRKHCDGLIAIPIQPQIESLNISVASSIALFEANRQRHYRETMP